MEIAERDLEIQQLKQQIKKHELDKTRILTTLGVDNLLKKSSGEITISADQYQKILSILTQERRVSVRKSKTDFSE